MQRSGSLLDLDQTKAPTSTGALAYGGVIFDEQGRVLLQKPSGEFDGFVWTFPKGRPYAGESPEATALREVAEETGLGCEIVARIPGTFQGGMTQNVYFAMRGRADSGTPTDWETEALQWAAPEEAVKLIGQTRNAKGRRRDLAVLEAALEVWRAQRR